ncbi:MAG: hypothetical protein ACI8VC_000716 [Candidatus Endobugula sp.]
MSDYISPKSINSPQGTLPAGKVNNTSQTSLAKTETTNTTTRSATDMVNTLVKQLTQQKTINANVSSSQLLDSKAQQLLAKNNPNVAAQMNATDASSAQKKTALYLVKLASTATTSANNAASNYSMPKGSAINSPLMSGSVMSGSVMSGSVINSPLMKGSTMNNAALLTTVTTTPFKVGDQVELLLNKQGQIVVKPNVSSVRPAIAENFKQALPQQQSLSQLLNTASSIGKLPTAMQNVLLANTTQLPLRQLGQFAYQPAQLQLPSQIKTALQQSGVLTESRLQQQQPIGNDLRSVLGQLLHTLQQETSVLGSQKNDPAFSKTPFDQIINLLVQQLPQQAAASKTSGNSTTQPLASLMQLLGVKMAHNAQSDTKKLRDVATKQLEQMAKGIQEKVHLNQLRSLGADGQVNDDINYSSARTNAFVTEISLRWGEHVLPLQISITEEEPKKNEDSDWDEQDEKKITRRWQVFMSFDLPADASMYNSAPSVITNPMIDPTQPSPNTQYNRPPTIETLHSKLTIIDDTVSATLWSESFALCQKAKQHFTVLRNTLTAHGLQVDELHCINGKPPSQDVSLDYNLIDIKT